MRGIGKRFSGVEVQRAVDFDVAAGEVHVLAGENGAGKSTLVRILGGGHTDYEGEIRLDAGRSASAPRSTRPAAGSPGRGGGPRTRR